MTTHVFYIQNASRRSAQSFPIRLADGATLANARDDFAKMMNITPDEIIRLTAADGRLILPGHVVPSETLVLEVERRAFEKITGAGEIYGLSVWSSRTLVNTVIPVTIIFLLFAGYVLILAGLASASNECKNVSTVLISSLFTWVAPLLNAAGASPNPEFACGLALSLFWWIITAELLVVIFPAFILLFWAGSFTADTKGSWAYIITCTLNILTALLCYEAFVVVPGSYYASNIPGAAGKFIAAVKVMSAGVIILTTANFFYILSQAFGKMIPERFQCCSLCTSCTTAMKAPLTFEAPATPSTPNARPKVVPTHSPMVSINAV